MQNHDIAPPTNAQKVDADADAVPRLKRAETEQTASETSSDEPQRQFLRKHWRQPRVMIPPHLRMTRRRSSQPFSQQALQKCRKTRSRWHKLQLLWRRNQAILIHRLMISEQVIVDARTTRRSSIVVALPRMVERLMTRGSMQNQLLKYVLKQPNELSLARTRSQTL